MGPDMSSWMAKFMNTEPSVQKKYSLRFHRECTAFGPSLIPGVRDFELSVWAFSGNKYDSFRVTCAAYMDKFLYPLHLARKTSV